MSIAPLSLADELAAFENGRIDPALFPHREHVRFAYEMLRRYPLGQTITRFSRGLQLLAQRANQPQLFHETITVAFLAIIGERCARAASVNWLEFSARNEDLFDKEVLHRWYSAAQLQSQLARRTFCLPTPNE